MEEDKNIKTQIDALKIEEIEEFQEIAQPFISLMMEFRCALMEIETKLNVLNSEFALTHNRNPIQTIKTRLKQPVSILEKLHRKELEVNIFNVEEYLADIAGVRVICSFPEDIYTVADLLLHQDDIRMLEIKDYIKKPKESGYRSLHLIVEVPIFLSEGKKPRKVEIQFRTIDVYKRQGRAHVNPIRSKTEQKAMWLPVTLLGGSLEAVGNGSPG